MIVRCIVNITKVNEGFETNSFDDKFIPKCLAFREDLNKLQRAVTLQPFPIVILLIQLRIDIDDAAQLVSCIPLGKRRGGTKRREGRVSSARIKEARRDEFLPFRRTVTGLFKAETGEESSVSRALQRKNITRPYLRVARARRVSRRVASRRIARDRNRKRYSVAVVVENGVG